MKNIPIFSTELGVASLILREIPYSGKAYVRIQDSQMPEAFLQECAGFCRGAGAKLVYAAGAQVPESYPLHTVMLRLSCPRQSLPDTRAALFPVTEKTLETFREIFNRRMAEVPNSAWMTMEDGAAMLEKGDGYFIHSGDTLLGIGRASAGTLDAVASVARGGGRQSVLALAHAITEDTVCLTAASTNVRAMRLYESLGFQPVQEIARWYEISQDVK